MKAVYLHNGVEIDFYPEGKSVVAPPDVKLTSSLVGAIRYMYENGIGRLSINGQDGDSVTFKEMVQTLGANPDRLQMPTGFMTVTLDSEGMVNVVSEEFYYASIAAMYQGGNGFGFQSNTENIQLNEAVKEMCHEIADAVHAFKKKEKELIHCNQPARENVRKKI